MPRQTALILAFILPSLAIAQTNFEIADVHVSPKTLHPTRKGGALRAGLYELQMATMVELVAAAWGIQPNKVLGGPAWLETDRFDVIARAPLNTSPQDLKLMLQALLADRFQLTVHTDQKPMAAYTLSVGSAKPKMKESQGDTPPGCQRQPQAAEAGAIPATCHGITMEAFAGLLSGAAGDYLTSSVVDNTKLEGTWDFTLKWTPHNSLIAAGPDGISIFDAIDKQLGLKLELKQLPAPVVVVDRVNEKPTENPPGITTALPPPPLPQFEAATIKPTDPAVSSPRLQVTPSVNISGVTLSFLIQNIWFITPEMIANAPTWLDNDRWDIVAKVAAPSGSAPNTDFDSMIVMVRDLLEDRFKLKTHIEERTIPAWTLTSLRPKLQKANTANRTGCSEGPGPQGKILVTCHNMTISQFAERLPRIPASASIANAPLHSAVLDSTGLDGAWDFTFAFNLTGPIGPTETSSDPDGRLSLFEAISQQLGLKLALEKRPAPVLVIDHVEKPSGN